MKNNILSDDTIEDGEDFDKKNYLEHLSNDIFTVKYKDNDSGKTFEINPLIDDVFWDSVYRNNFRSGRYTLIDGELPEKWK